MVVTATLAIASVCLVLAGYGGKESRTSLTAQNAKVAPIFHKTTRLDDAAPAADDAAELGLMQKQNSQRNISHNGYQRRARLDCKQNTTTYEVRL
jgi:hypothetical protein